MKLVPYSLSGAIKSFGNPEIPNWFEKMLFAYFAKAKSSLWLCALMLRDLGVSGHLLQYSFGLALQKSFCVQRKLNWLSSTMGEAEFIQHYWLKYSFKVHSLALTRCFISNPQLTKSPPLCFSAISLPGGTDIVSCFMGQNPTVPVYRGEIQTRNLGMAVEAWSLDGKCVCECVCILRVAALICLY